MHSDERARAQPYVALARRLLAGGIGAVEFERAFLELWGDDEMTWSADTFRIMDRFFFVVEDYVHDAELRDPGEPGPAELEAGAREFLAELAAL
jgi:hypothetical protein